MMDLDCQFSSLRGRHGLVGIGQAFGVMVVVFGGLPAGAAERNAPPVQWRSGSVDASPKDAVGIREALSALAADPATDHLVVQFDGPVDQALRTQLQSAGLRLLNYLGSNPFFASISAKGADVEAVVRTLRGDDLAPVVPARRWHPKASAFSFQMKELRQIFAGDAEEDNSGRCESRVSPRTVSGRF